MTASIVTSFDAEWDVMPSDRVKYIHSVGGVCKFTLDIKNSPYTGIMKRGNQTGIIRLGSARDISNGAGVKPGAALKFLRTGRSSANTFALNGVNPVPNKDYNFFAIPLFSQMLPIPPRSLGERVGISLKDLGEKKFKQASQCAFKIGLSDMAR